MKKTIQKSSRRQFLKSAAAVGVATRMDSIQIVPRHILGGVGFVPPSETVNIAGIGIGGMGGVDVRAAAHVGAKVVALCDVNDKHAAGMYKAFPEATRYRDFRRLLEKEKGIDGVIVGTPDHTHAAITLATMELGKHVYCEKPLAHTMVEVRKVTEAARRYKVATQMGNQGRSFASIRSFCECIWSGAIGKVREIHLVEGGHTQSYIGKLGKMNEDHVIPETLDWDQWLGPAPVRKYNPMYLPGIWRGWSQFGSGMMGDWICHLADPVFMALDLGAPTSVIAEAKGYDPTLHRETFPESTHARFEFPARGEHPPVTLHWYDGLHYRPERPDEFKEGEEFIPVPQTGWSNGQPFGGMVVGDEGKIIYGSHGAIGWRIVPEEKMKAYEAGRSQELTGLAKDLTGGAVHQKQWLEACKGGEQASSNFDYGGPLAEIAMLGNIGLRMLGTQLEWDAPNMRITNCKEANAYLHYPYRDGWKL